MRGGGFPGGLGKPVYPSFPRIMSDLCTSWTGPFDPVLASGGRRKAERGSSGRGNRGETNADGGALCGAGQSAGGSLPRGGGPPRGIRLAGDGDEAAAPGGAVEGGEAVLHG